MQLLLKKYYLFQTLLWGFFFVSTAYFNRFAADDFYFINEIKAKSSYDIFYHLQYEWHGRFASNFLLSWLIQWLDTSWSLMVFNITCIALLFLAMLRLSIIISRRYLTSAQPIGWLILTSVSVFFFISFSVNDVWFWLTGAMVYFTSAIALFFLVGSLINPDKKIVDFILIFICSLFIGGSNETMTIIILLFLGYFFFYKHYSKSDKIAIVISAAILISGFAVIYFSTGTAYRDKITPSLNAMDVVLYTGYATVKTLFFQFHKTFLPALILALPLIFLRIKIKDKERFNPIKEFIFSSILIGGVVFINHLIAVIPLGALSPERITTVSSVLILILLLRYLILLGNKITISEKVKKVILLTNTIGMLIFVVVMFNRHKNYAEAYDARMEKLTKLKKTVSHQDPIYLEPLPVSGYIPTAEITTDTTHFLNVDLKNHFNLKNDLILRK